jgi:hypothetical protein
VFLLSRLCFVASALPPLLCRYLNSTATALLSVLPLPLSLLPLPLFYRDLCRDASAPLWCIYSASYTPLSCLCCHRFAAFDLLCRICSFCSAASALPPLRSYLNSTATALLSVLPLPLSLLPLHLFYRRLCCDASALVPLLC